MFLNREKERARIERLGTFGKKDFAVIYGRRRCGKSTLIKHVATEKDVYFLAGNGTAQLQRDSFVEVTSRTHEWFSTVDRSNWSTIFRALLSRKDIAFNLYIDEFPLLVKEDASLTGVLQSLIDTKEMPFNLIICGSSQQMMRGLVDYSSPLYGRAEEIIQVFPLKPGWINDMFPALTQVQCIEEYAVWGGVPRYWELRNRFNSLREAIEEMLLDPAGTLYNEPQRLLLDDLRELTQPITILTIVANGANRLSEIAARAGKPAADLHRPLTRLIDLGYVSKEQPYGAHPRKGKTTLYVVADPFIRFYYRFVAPNLSRIEMNLPESTYDRIALQLPQFTGRTWEDVCQLALARGLGTGEVITGLRRWWGTNTNRKPMELDAVGHSEDGRQLIVAECKWSHVTNEAKLREELLAKARALPFYDGEEIITVIAAKSFADEPTGLVLTPSEVLPALRY